LVLRKKRDEMPFVIGYSVIISETHNPKRKAFQMSPKDKRIIAQKEKKLKRRLKRKLKGEQGRRPMLSEGNIHYEMGERVQAIGCGGIGAIQKLVKRVGLCEAIDKRLKLLKVHRPYFESDHVLNITYSVLNGGTCLEDIERQRADPVYMDALGTERLPDPTTAGDFTRRFDPQSIEQLMECINQSRKRVWKKRGKKLLKDALIDIDGTLAGTAANVREAWILRTIHGC